LFKQSLGYVSEGLLYQLYLVLVNRALSHRHHQLLIVPLRQAAYLLLNIHPLLVKRFNLFQNDALKVAGRCGGIEVIEVTVIGLWLLVVLNVNSAGIISLDVDVIDPVLEFEGGLLPVVMHRLLDFVLVDVPDGPPAALAVPLVHDAQEVFLPHSIGFDSIKCLVQEFRSLFVEERVVVDHDRGMSLLFHHDLSPKELLVEKSIPDTHHALGHKNSLKHLLILILDDLILLEVPWLQNSNEITDKRPDARGLESLRQLVFLKRLHRLKVKPISVQEVVP